MNVNKEMNFIAPLEKLDSSVYGHCVKVPQAISDYFLQTTGRRIYCHINHQVHYQCALMPLGENSYFINVTKSLHKQLGIKVGDKLNISLTADLSKYGLPMPEELEVLLEQDQEGTTVFHSLTPGNQRNLLYIIGKPKNSDLRLKKALCIVNYLKKVNGKLDFKELNQALKE